MISDQQEWIGTFVSIMKNPHECIPYKKESVTRRREKYQRYRYHPGMCVGQETWVLIQQQQGQNLHSHGMGHTTYWGEERGTKSGKQGWQGVVEDNQSLVLCALCLCAAFPFFL